MTEYSTHSVTLINVCIFLHYLYSCHYYWNVYVLIDQTEKCKVALLVILNDLWLMSLEN